jgi:hypothetical protein
VAIRMLRLLEYVYENEEVAAADMARWTHVVNTGHMTMRSATLQLESVLWGDDSGATGQCSECLLYWSHYSDCSRRSETTAIKQRDEE